MVAARGSVMGQRHLQSATALQQRRRSATKEHHRRLRHLCVLHRGNGVGQARASCKESVPNTSLGCELQPPLIFRKPWRCTQGPTCDARNARDASQTRLSVAPNKTTTTKTNRSKTTATTSATAATASTTNLLTTHHCICSKHRRDFMSHVDNRNPQLLRGDQNG